MKHWTADKINPFFSILSAAYISGIFLGADSPAISGIGDWNPFSLLHIPLYGILTLLLFLAFRVRREGKIGLRHILAVLISAAVGILDEYHQSFIPARDASLGDVLLDMAGASSAMILTYRFSPLRRAGFMKKFPVGRRAPSEEKDRARKKEIRKKADFSP